MALVLVVDDDEMFRPVLERILQRLGHDVLTARNGAQALEHHAAHAPDVVITDLIMPDIEGLQTIRELKKRDSNVRVIAMSGGGRSGPGDYLKLAATLGARCTLCKPFSIQELADALAVVLADDACASC